MKAYFILALLVSTLCIRNDGEVEKFFPVAVGLFKGMAKNDEQRCAKSVEGGKDTIIPAVEKAIEEIKAGEDITSVIIELAWALLDVEGLITECRVLYMTDLADKFTTKEGIAEILQALIQNIDEVWAQGQKIPQAITDEKYEEAGQAFGVIFRLATDFYVN